MYARLWWKDARQFGPIWVFLALAAAVVQELLLYFLGQDARNGALGVSALICASLYAFATGAAAFASERETGTLGLLDSLPIDRRVVWAGKVSFALFTTAVLAVVLLAMAAASSEGWKPQGALSEMEALCYGTIVLLALGWGLFWSAILTNALTAAVVAICCTAASLSLLMSRLDAWFAHRVGLPVFALGQFLIFLTTLVASVVIFARVVRWKRFQLEFRSPILVNLAEPTNRRRAQVRVQSSIAMILAPMPSSVLGAPGLVATDRSTRRSWIVEVRAVAWQTMIEGGKTWCLLAALGLVLPPLILLNPGANSPEWLLLDSVGIALVAGASVFGLENRARTQRFLTHHGAQPGLVWPVKLAVWGPAIALMLVPAAVFIFTSHQNQPFLTLVVPPFFFSIALVCGMAIRRGITAVVIALVIALVLFIPLLPLIVADMLPVQGLLVIAAGLVVVSWAWRGDWLMDRPGFGRWVRLGLLVAGVGTLAVSGFAAYRAWSIRDVGPIAPPVAWAEATASSLPADQNAADLYREAGRRLVGPFQDSPEFLDRNRGIVDLLRRAAARPHCRFLHPENLSILDRPDLPPVIQLANLLALDASERQNRGDLAGAWDDITTLFRMAHQLGDTAGFMINPIWVERIALGQALEWAVARSQTPERLRAALAAYHDLPAAPPATDAVRAEANLVENALELPASRLRDWIFEATNGDARSQRAYDAVLFDLATMPWERVCARRVNRLISHAAIQDAMREPWQRSRTRDTEIDHARKTSQNAMMLIRNPEWYVNAADHNEVARRALVQVLALREWQLKHGGRFPDTLDVLVPQALPGLPADPYSGLPFHYVRSDRNEVPPLRYALMPAREKGRAPTPGSRLIYSVGPDHQDNGGITFTDQNYSRQSKDIVFEVPPLQNEAGAGKGKVRAQNSAKDHPAPAGKPASPSPRP